MLPWPLPPPPLHRSPFACTARGTDMPMGGGCRAWQGWRPLLSALSALGPPLSSGTPSCPTVQGSAPL